MRYLFLMLTWFVIGALLSTTFLLLVGVIGHPLHVFEEMALLVGVALSIGMCTLNGLRLQEYNVRKYIVKNKDSIEIKLTPTDIVELIEKKTGQKVSVDSHWFETIIENTREYKPYALVTFRANLRK